MEMTPKTKQLYNEFRLDVVKRLKDEKSMLDLLPDSENEKVARVCFNLLIDEFDMIDDLLDYYGLGDDDFDDEDDFDDNDETLTENEEREYYCNVLAPQFADLNRR